jgi:hypothetical protein
MQIKGIIHQQKMKIVYLYALNVTAHKFIKQAVLDLKAKI